jgi:hypothetical protein
VSNGPVDEQKAGYSRAKSRKPAESQAENKEKNHEADQSHFSVFNFINIYEL